MEKEITTPQVQIKKDPHEDLVLELCKKLGITVKQLRGKTTREISAARMEIIKELSGIDGLTYKRMGELIGVSEKIVGYYFRKIKANVAKDAMADLAHKEIVSHADPDNDPDLPPGDIKKTPKEFGLGDEALKASEAASALAASAMDAISADASIIDWAALRDTNIYKIEIDFLLCVHFSNHPEVLQDLVEMAARDLRDPDKQALFILRHIYEKGLKIG